MDQLPVELLWQIFDYLDLRSIKNASITCKRWEQIIVSNNKRVAQFIFQDKQSVHEMMARLKVSRRKFTNVTLCWNRSASGFFREGGSVKSLPMVDIFSCFQLQQLVVLKLVLPHNIRTMFEPIIEAVPKMERLTALHITLINPHSGGNLIVDIYESDSMLSSNSLRHLELHTFLPNWMYLPALKSVDLADTLYTRMIYSARREHYLLLTKNLEELTLSRPHRYLVDKVLLNRPGFKLQFYQQLTGLKKLHLFESKTAEAIFRAICNWCTRLTELRIRRLEFVDPHAVRHLSQLPHLCRLTVNKWKAPAPISFDSAYLPNLEHLQLGRGSFVLDSFRVFGAVKSLGLSLPMNQCVVEPLRAIAKHMPKLTALRCHLGRLQACQIGDFLESLHLFATVREMVLENGDFTHFICQPETRPMAELQKLSLHHCQMDPESPPWLRHMFPNLI